jgi:very-short-patch-repair endonuclease
MLGICADTSLPAPVPNAPIELVDGAVVDFLWPDHALVVETDGWQTHGTRAAFERDRSRDQRLMLAGYRVVRFTWRQVFDRPAEVVLVLSGLLSSGAGSTTTRR